MATWVKDINTDPGCNRIVDSDMVSGSSPGLVVIMAPGSGEGHPDWHGSSSSMAQGSPTWPQVVAQATGIGMALYGNRSHVYQQTLAAVGPGAHRWPLAAAQPRHHCGPGWQADLPLSLLFMAFTTAPGGK